MSYRQQQRGGGRYEPDPWQSGNGWGGQQMWQGGGQGGYGGGHYQGGGGQGGYGGGHQQGNQGYYQQGPPHGMRQAPQRHGGGYQQQARGYGNRPPMQQAHQVSTSLQSNPKAKSKAEQSHHCSGCPPER